MAFLRSKDENIISNADNILETNLSYAPALPQSQSINFVDGTETKEIGGNTSRASIDQVTNENGPFSFAADLRSAGVKTGVKTKTRKAELRYYLVIYAC